MQLLIVFIMVVLFLLFGIVVRVVASDLDKAERPVAFEVKVMVSEDGCNDESPVGNISRRKCRGVRQRRRKAGAGEVSHYAKMHSRTRYRI